MGLISKIFGIGRVAKDIAEVFVPNKTKAAQHSHLKMLAAQEQFADEFQHARIGYFDSFIDALNRMPRPFLALGTVGLFIYALIDPAGFEGRMQGLSAVPEPLWWLLGAIVSFYFGAREMHYKRRSTPNYNKSKPATNSVPQDRNLALEEWFEENG